MRLFLLPFSCCPHPEHTKICPYLYLGLDLAMRPAARWAMSHMARAPRFKSFSDAWTGLALFRLYSTPPANPAIIPRKRAVMAASHG